MTKLFHFLFPVRQHARPMSFLLLALRWVFGSFFLWHGLQKWAAFDILQQQFPDPLGVGTTFSLLLAISAEVLGSLAIMFGFLHRLALLPMMFTMCVAIFSIHARQPFAEKELAVLYLSVFVLLFISGPGRYSIDRLIAERQED